MFTMHGLTVLAATAAGKGMSMMNIAELVGGLVFFMFGMRVMSQALEKMAGGRLERMLKQTSSNPVVSVALGAGITIAMQSSSATTVMLVGLVNSGIMQFGQTLAVIFGANIGTTFTAWLLTLGSISSGTWWLTLLKPEFFSPFLALLGIGFLMFSKRDKYKSIGTVFVGFAILMNGMNMMSSAVSPLRDVPEFKELMTKFNNPLFGVLIGLLITAVIQSSAATIGILIAISEGGILTVGMAIPIIMGLNIGTCATSLISCIGTNYKAKRVATVHVMIKILGTAIWLSVFCALQAINSPAVLDSSIGSVGIAIVHTAFNLATTIVLMPFSGSLTKLTERIIKQPKEESEMQENLSFLDVRVLRSPSVAVAECNNLTKKMAEIACQNLFDAMSLFDNYSEATVAEVLKKENELDMYEDKLGSYLVNLSSKPVSDNDGRVISKMLHTIGDFERLGDHAVNLYKAAEEIREKRLSFTPVASAELRVLTNAIDEILTMTTECYTKADMELAFRVEPLEQVIDKLTSTIKTNHIVRLQKGGCSIEMGFILSDLLNNYERISDHCSNIAVAVIEVERGGFDTHEYLSGIKFGNLEFNQIYDSFDKKYSLE